MNILGKVLYKGHYNRLIYSIFIMEEKLILFMRVSARFRFRL
jgi:hypothetical protein